MDDIKQNPSFIALRDGILEHRAWLRKFRRWQIGLLLFNSVCLFSVALSFWADDGAHWGSSLLCATLYTGLICFHTQSARRFTERSHHLNNALNSLAACSVAFSYTAAEHHLDQAAAAVQCACK